MVIIDSDLTGVFENFLKVMYERADTPVSQ